MADVEKVSNQHEEDVPQGMREAYIDPVVEKRVRRKMDRNLMPLVMALYLVSFLDRSNIGNAKTAGMNDDLNISDSQFQWLLTIFYIPYILFEWMALIWKVVPPHIWAFVTVMTWGIAATAQAGAFNWTGMMVARFFMATAEAGYGPGLPFLLSFFYMRSEIGLRCGIFLSAAPLATCFAGALAYGITSGHSMLANWRLLFLVEGIPSMLMACVAFVFLPDSPEKARFLEGSEEIEVAKARAIRQVGQEGASRVGGVNFKDVAMALIDVKNWLTALMYFSCNVSFSSLPVFLPTILKEMGYTAINAQGLTAPPYFLSFLMCIGTTYIADRTRQRGFVIIVLSLIGATGYVILATVESTGIRYFAIFLAAAGVFPSISNILPWVLNNQGSDSKRGTGIAILNIIGQCGPILGTRIFPEAQGPYYVKGMGICAGFMFFNALLALTLRQYLDWQNKLAIKREAEQQMSGDGKEDKAENVAVENEGFGFRNIL